jgi:hypothetical protein
MYTDKYGPPSSSPSPYSQGGGDLFVWKNKILSFQINNYDATVKKGLNATLSRKALIFLTKNGLLVQTENVLISS